jgi:hypothetical protein
MASSLIPATCAAEHTLTLRVLLAAGAALATELRVWSCILSKAASRVEKYSNVLLADWCGSVIWQPIGLGWWAHNTATSQSSFTTSEQMSALIVH